jgi:hypothetical protein
VKPKTGTEAKIIANAKRADKVFFMMIALLSNVTNIK